MKYNQLRFLFIALSIWSCSADTSPTVVEISSPTNANASLPHLITGEDDALYISWVEKNDLGLVSFYYAKMNEDKWSEPELIASGDDWFVNWADYPMIAVDKNGNMMASYLAKSSGGTYSYDVNVMYKPTTSNWTGPVVPHTDSTPTEHGFVTLLPQNDNTFLISWLDGRNTAGHEGHEGHGGGAMTIRSAVMDMNGQLTEESELDSRVCDCCQTAGAITAKGAVIAYRDRSEDEIRDMSLVCRTNGIWSAPVSVSQDNWNIKGCPVNGPRISAKENALGMAWFTAANDEPKVKVRFSADNGASFGKEVEVANKTVGRVDIAMIDTKSAIVSWLATSDTASYIMSKHVRADGSQGEPMIIAKTSSARSSGFPQLSRWKNKNYFAWTHVEENSTKIKLARTE